MPSLRLKIGGGATKSFALAEGDCVGRLKGVAIVLPHESVSRRHAVVHVNGDKVEIEDLSSSNGTFVNDRQIVRQGLANGDRVRFGKVVLEFDAGDAGLPSAVESRATTSSAEAPLRADFGDDEWAAEDELQLPDELVAPAANEPRIEVRARPSEPAPTVRASASAPEEEPEVRRRVLQYRKVEAKGGLLGQDLAQWGFFSRAAALVALLALSAGIFWLAKWLGSGFGG